MKSAKKLIPHIILSLTVPALTFASCSSPAVQIKNLKTDVQSIKTPNKDSISLKINTGLAKNGNGKIVDLTALLEEDGFKTQAVPQGTVIFQETFVQANAPLEQLREINITDTSKRYSLHVQKLGDKTNTVEVNVNINGQDWILEKDFRHQTTEAQRTSLLLNQKNSLRIKIKSPQGASVKISLVEGGEAGTLIKRQGKLGKTNETNATHLNQNDVNIFDPDNPNSLGGLIPFEGDVPLTETPSILYGVAKANGSEAKIVSGRISVTLQEPAEQNLQILLNSYPVKLVSTDVYEGDTTAELEIDYTQASFRSLLSNIQILNQRPSIEEPLIEAEFSSVNLAKTIAVAFDIQTRSSNLIYGVTFDFVADKTAIAGDTKEENNPQKKKSIPGNVNPTELAKYSLPTIITPPGSMMASQFWWLNSIKAIDGWNLSNKGQGANVAVIDSGFGFIDQNPDFAGRVKLGSTPFNNLTQNCDPALPKLGGPCYQDQEIRGSLPKKLLNDPDHGLWVSHVLTAGADDSSGIAGVAPKATLYPMVATSSIEYHVKQKLKKILDNRTQLPIDIVNISMGRMYNFFDYYMPASNAYIQKYISKNGSSLSNSLPRLSVPLYELLEIIEKLKQRNTIVVVAAGNDNKDVVFTPPGSTYKNTEVFVPAVFPNVIAVGAYEITNGRKVRSNANLYVGGGDTHLASNYGANVNIWAPGEGIWTEGQGFDSSLSVDHPIPKDFHKDQWIIREGTSFAAPQVAGAIALMKSLNKNLTFDQIKDILVRSGEKLTDSSFTNPLNTGNYALNVGAALADPRVRGGSLPLPGLKAVFFANQNATGTPMTGVRTSVPLLNFVGFGQYGDTFGIGRSDNFSARFYGTISLPNGYPTGNYTIIVGHDDGAILSIDSQVKINAWGPHDYAEHSTNVTFSSATDKKTMELIYYEGGSEAELGLKWRTPSGVTEYIPTSALSYTP